MPQSEFFPARDPGDLRPCVYLLTATLTNNRKTRGRKMEESNAARETRLRELASKLLFTISKERPRFPLFRDTDVPQPVLAGRTR